jgi:hypothetical protein
VCRRETKTNLPRGEEEDKERDEGWKGRGVMWGRTKGWDVRKSMDQKIGHKGESPKRMRLP